MRWEILSAFDGQISVDHVLLKIIKIGQGILKLQSKMSGMVFFNHSVVLKINIFSGLRREYCSYVCSPTD